jgi:hypothetical protein
MDRLATVGGRACFLDRAEPSLHDTAAAAGATEVGSRSKYEFVYSVISRTDVAGGLPATRSPIRCSIRLSS